MTEKLPKTLLIASHSYAGMGPYVASIVNSFLPEDDVMFFLVEKEDRYYTRNISNELESKAIIITEKSPSKLKTLFNMMMGCRMQYRTEIKKLCTNREFEVVHSLTSLSDVGLTQWLAEKFNLIYTIHDLTPHEADKGFHKRLRQNIFYSKIFQAISKCKHLITNSKSQLNEMRSMYRLQTCHYIDFPTLITEEIENGKKVPEEIKYVSDYILFFGRIEAYKGVDILIDAFLRYKEMEGYKGEKLVIAGKGDFNREPIEGVIYIDRYIDDSEIAEMYRRAKCVVYPYISGTQSGVLSVASFFSTPIILSDIPFFKEVMGNDYPMFFPVGNSMKLSELLKEITTNPLVYKECVNASSGIYKEHYSKSNFRNQLIDLYSNVIK